MRFHLLGLAHTKTSREFAACAFTQKILKEARMFSQIGEVIHYGAEGSDVPCEHVTVISDGEQRSVYGDRDWRKKVYAYDARDLAYTIFNDRAAQAIQKRAGPNDFLLITFGHAQRPIADELRMPFTVESGVGYEGIFAPFHVFESYAWMHHLYGRLGMSTGNWYDAVIPNSFDPADFQLATAPGSYLLYIGRLIEAKGVHIAAQVADAAGLPLVVAGQGNPEALGVANNAKVRCVGVVGPADRNELMGGAIALLAPTLYIEPFGGVAVEAQLCGTPVITTDWGAFPETVEHGMSGFRCRTMDDFLFSIGACGKLDRASIRARAVKLYSMDTAREMYREYFGKLDDIRRDGWYQRHPERTSLDWLRRTWA